MSTGTVAPGFGGGGTLTASSLSLAASSVLNYTLGSGTATDSRLGIAGSLTLSTGLTLTVSPGASWGNGTYVLATYGSLTNNSSSFSGWTVGGSPLLGRHTYGFSVGSGSLDLTVGSAAGVNGTWNASGGGSWSTAGDWQGGNIPGYSRRYGHLRHGHRLRRGDRDARRRPRAERPDAEHHRRRQLHPQSQRRRHRQHADPGQRRQHGDGERHGGSQTIAVPVTLLDNVSVSAASAASLTVSGAIGDGGAGKSLTLSGAGTLILAGADTYSGGTTLSSGQLNLNNASALGTGPFTISGGTLGNTSGAAITLSTNNAQNWNGDFTFAGSNDFNLGSRRRRHEQQPHRDGQRRATSPSAASSAAAATA